VAVSWNQLILSCNHHPQPVIKYPQTVLDKLPMEELVQFLILSVIASGWDYPLIILQELGKSTLEHPIRATTDKILLLDIWTFL
jgi:hypothetical protein